MALATCNTRIENDGMPFNRGRSLDVGCQSAVLRRKKLNISAEFQALNVYVQELKVDNEGETHHRKLRKPCSVATAIDTLKDENTTTLKTDDYWDPWDYDRMWSEISTMDKNNISRPKQNKREGIQVSCVKRQPSDQTPLLSRRNIVLSRDNEDDDELSNIPSSKKNTNIKTCMTLPAMGSRDKSLLPKNALVRYLGKAVLSTNEIVNLDLTRPVQDLYNCRKSGANNNLAHRVTKATFSSEIDLKTKLRIGENLVSYDNGFVLLRINEKHLELEDTSPVIVNSRRDIRREGKKNSESSKSRKLSKHDSQLSSTSKSKLFRRKSSPHIQRNNKKSVEFYSGQSTSFTGYTSDDEIKRNRKAGRCVDIFSCMNCTRRKSDGDVISDDDSQTFGSNQTPCHTNVVAKFELPRIAYCGSEIISGSYLLVWVYHVSICDIHVIECHAAECDDRQHAKSLSASLGVSIQKAVRSKKNRVL